MTIASAEFASGGGNKDDAGSKPGAAKACLAMIFVFGR